MKVDHICKIFTGLSHERIFILLTLNVTIDDFDACLNYDEKRNKQLKKSSSSTKGTFVKRYSNHFRVFVKFQSYPVADSAISRSGEAIYIDDQYAAAVGVMPISKTVAIHIQKFMAIDGKKGEVLEDVLDETENQIPNAVSEIVWSMSRKELDIHFLNKTIGGGKSGAYPTIETDELYNIFPPRTKEEQHKLVILHNNLLDMYESLEKECTPFMMQEFNPILSSISPTHRLTMTASMWILDQLETIQKCLDSYRRYQCIGK